MPLEKTKKKKKKLALSTYDPWLLAGDFNAYTSLEEKKGGDHPNFSLYNSFNRCICECGLIDLRFSGPQYTYRRGGVQSILTGH